MSRKKYLLTLDAGTGAGRCVVFDLSGNQVARAYREWCYSPLEGVPGACEFEPREAWSTLAALAREALHTSGIAGDEVAAVACTSQRQGMVLLDRDGHELRGIPNADRRATLEGEELRTYWGKLAYGTAGRWPGDLHPASKLAWFKRHDPATLKRVAAVLTLSDWLNYRLSGELASEPTAAAETCFMDVCGREWWEGLASSLGLPLESLPPLRQAGEVLGSVTVRAAEECGLARGTPVVLAGADTQCGSLGAGAAEHGQVAMIAGTSTPVHLVIQAPVFDLLGRTLTNCHLLRGRWILESNALITGQTYRWLRDLCYRNEGPETSFDTMDQEAGLVPPGAAGLVAYAGASVMDSSHGSFLPRGGLLFPLPLTAGVNRGRLARALLESYAYAVRANLEQLAGISDLAFDRLYGGGGGMRSRLWVNMVASTTGLPVLRPRVLETTALGAAMCAAVGIGAYGSLVQAAGEMGATEEQTDPEPLLSATYQELYQDWMNTYTWLKEGK